MPVTGVQTCALPISGRHPNRMGVFWPGMPLRKQEVTIAQVAKQAGYNRYKLVKTPKQFELYDLTADLAEATNIAADHADVVERMKGELEAWQQSVLRSFSGADYEGGKLIAPPTQTSNLLK